MAKQVKVKKINKSLIITITKNIYELYGVREGTHPNLEPQTSNSFRLVVKK